MRSIPQRSHDYRVWGELSVHSRACKASPSHRRLASGYYLVLYLSPGYVRAGRLPHALLQRCTIPLASLCLLYGSGAGLLDCILLSYAYFCNRCTKSTLLEAGISRYSPSTALRTHLSSNRWRWCEMISSSSQLDLQWSDFRTLASPRKTVFVDNRYPASDPPK